MRAQQLTLCFSAFLAAYAIPNNYEGPEAFHKVLERQAVGGVSTQAMIWCIQLMVSNRIAILPVYALDKMVPTLDSV